MASSSIGPAVPVSVPAVIGEQPRRRRDAPNRDPRQPRHHEPPAPEPPIANTDPTASDEPDGAQPSLDVFV
ncbi:MAG: hypothetical protein U0610_21845 [bacterium]